MKGFALKYKDKALYIVTTILFFVIGFMNVKYCNAGHSYQQDVPFRIICICIALIALIHLPLKDTLTVWSLIWLPICYVITHIGYEKHLIPDNCDYQFVDLIRLGKLVVLLWGLMLIALLKHLVREDLPGKFFSWLISLDILKKTAVAGWCIYALVLTAVNPGYSYVIVFTLGFPAVIIACRGEKERKRLFSAFLDGVLLCFLVLSAKSLLHRPYDTERYLFYFSNENMAGMYLSVVMITLIYRIEKAWKTEKSGPRTVYLVAGHILIVWAGILVMYNYTRTYLLGMGFSLFVYFCIRVASDKEKKRFIFRFFLPVILILLCLYPGYLVIRYVPAYSDSPVFFYGEEGNANRVQPGDPVDSPRYTSIKRYFRLAFGKLGINLDLDDGEEREEQESFVEIDEDRDVSNGRLTVWKYFLERMSLRPHNPGHIVVGDDWVIYHAHNTYFQNMFQFGIPTGVLFACVIFLTYVFSIHAYVKKRSGSFPLLAMGTMMVGMLTEWSGHPAYPYGMFLLLVLHVLVFSDPLKKNIEDKADGGSKVAER